MRRILTVMLLSLLCVSVHAQLISFDALKEGVYDLAEIKKELILNGFTKVTASPKSDTDTYAYDYDETEKTASIRVNITPLIELENAGLYSISVLTSGDYIHDDLVEEITENCSFDRIGMVNELVYSCDYAIFLVYSQDGNSAIIANPNFQQIPAHSPIMEEMKKMNIGDMQELFKERHQKEEGQ